MFSQRYRVYDQNNIWLYVISQYACVIYICVGVVRGGRVFGTLVRELGEKRQKG